MLKIYIARHGQNVDNLHGILNGHRDEPLTALGEDQAHTTATHIKDAALHFDAIYSSPLTRALKTAEIIAHDIGAEAPIIEENLIERDFGVMSGQLIADIEKLCAPDIIKTDTITYFLSPEGAETFPEVMERAKKMLYHIQSAHKDGSVLLVTHGDMGKMIYAAYYNLEWKDVLISFHFGNCEILLLSEDSPASEAHFFQQTQHNH
ncbi:MAG: histidine phosphatase family protein [Candidatus Pacebacteria bacterium]|nr:histidine phosphatase family protein [Candidatus Paceibacterota bacterium]